MSQKRPRSLRLLRVWRRRLLARFDRYFGAWMEEVPTWGASLLLHAAGLLLLALYLYAYSGRDRGDVIEARFAAQLTDDFTSLVDSDHAGDPFTTLKTDEPPSLSLEPAPPEITLTNQPKIPDAARFAPELAGPEVAVEPAVAPGPGKRIARRVVNRDDRFVGFGAAIQGGHVEDMTAPFSGRQSAELRAKLVRREGGTVKSEAAVEAGLDWLVRHQKGDGSWSLDYHAQCAGQACPEGSSMESDSAATGLALLPLLGAGHVHTGKSRYASNVKQGINWLVAHQGQDGDLWVPGSGMTHLYTHAIATMALCEAYGLSHDEGLRQPAQYAIDYIAGAQNPEDGGWRYTPGQAGDTSVFGWQMFALRSARLAGLNVPRNTIKGCRVYLDRAAVDPKKTTYSYIPGRDVSPVMTAEALLSRQYLGWPKTFPSLVKGAGHVARHLEGHEDRNIYYWYYATQLLHNMQNADWKKWNVRVRDGLVAMQVEGAGCARGSWDPQHPQPDAWGRTGGRLFLTSLSVLTLEVYYRYLPLYRPTDDDTLKLDAVADRPAMGEPKKEEKPAAKVGP